MLNLENFLHDSSHNPPEMSEKHNLLPKISIITPSYNQGRFLEANIISVINQCYPNYEHIIIDGGSSDSSIEILKSYNNKLSYWVSEPDRGQSHALNKGLSLATGSIIGWQNSDDLYLPSAFYRVSEIFKRFPEIEILYGDYLYIDEHNNIIHPKKYPPIFDIKEYLYVGANISNQAVFFKRSVLLKAGGFNEDLHYAMDFDLFLRCSNFARFKHIRAYLGGYRIHKSQKGQKTGIKTEEEYIKIRKQTGLKIKKDIPWKRQYQVQKYYYRIRRNILKLIYLHSYLTDPLYRGI